MLRYLLTNKIRTAMYIQRFLSAQSRFADSDDLDAYFFQANLLALFTKAMAGITLVVTGNISRYADATGSRLCLIIEPPFLCSLPYRLHRASEKPRLSFLTVSIASFILYVFALTVWFAHLRVFGWSGAPWDKWEENCEEYFQPRYDTFGEAGPALKWIGHGLAVLGMGISIIRRLGPRAHPSRKISKWGKSKVLRYVARLYSFDNEHYDN